MTGKYVIAYDFGTSGNKAAIFDSQLNCIAQTKEEYPIYYPKPGWAEQDAEDFWKSVVITTQRLIQESSINPEDVKALVSTCQMNCTIPIDKEGKPLMNCISWLDTRAEDIILKIMHGWPMIKGFYSVKKILKWIKITGGGPGPQGKDPVSHYLWIKETMPEIYNKTPKFLSVKDFIIYRCTKNAVISKDLGNTTWLMQKDPENLIWSEYFLEKLNLDRDKLPEIKDTHDIAGELTKEAAKELGLKPGIPVFVGSGDLTCVAIGSGGILNNQGIICLGTADWIGTHIDNRKEDIIHYVGTIHSAQNNYLCISKQETGAACLDWLKDILFMDLVKEYNNNSPEIYKKLDEIVEKSDAGANNLIFTPWMAGERSPLNSFMARGGLLNLRLDHARKDILRAVYEGVALNVKWGLIYLEKMVGKFDNLNFIGGGAKSDAWSQIMADVTNRTINQMEDPGLGGTKGATIIALVGLGEFKTFSEAVPLIKVKKRYTPNPENAPVYSKIFNEFANYYKRNRKMFKNLYY
jgi:xylulokinase